MNKKMEEYLKKALLALDDAGKRARETSDQLKDSERVAILRGLLEEQNFNANTRPPARTTR